MDYDEQAHLTGFVSGLLLGTVLGLGIALLTAPQSGTRTRKKLRRAAVDLREEAADRWDTLADDMKHRVDETVRSARKRIPSR